MESELKWIITKVDGKIASVSTSYKGASNVLRALANNHAKDYDEVECRKITTGELFELSAQVKWEDLLLLGTPFQISVWKKLFDITHSGEAELQLQSYISFAESLGKGPGVRAVAHAVGLNPVAVIIPCHLIIPKESIEKLKALEEDNCLFMWETLYMVDSRIDYGEYALGADLKRKLIQKHLTLQA